MTDVINSRRAAALALAAVVSALAAAGCSGGGTSTTPAAGTPVVSTATATPEVEPAPVSATANPESVLSSLVTFHIPGATLARAVATGGGETLRTPYVVADADGGGTVAVLGLLPETTYEATVEAMTPLGVSVPAAVTFTTAPLPSELAGLSFAVTTGTAAAGYYLVSGAGHDAFAFDETGAIRWYRAFGATTQETKMQPDGTFTTYVGSSFGDNVAAGEYVRYAPDGAEIARYAVGSPDTTIDATPTAYTDNHELLLTTDIDGSERLHLFGYSIAPAPGTTTAYPWHELLRQDTAGNVEFRWKSWSHFTIADELEGGLPGTIDHPNSIEIDPADGNYVVSFRTMDAILKIDATSGAVLWQLGGARSDFAFVGDALGGFSGQHSARALPGGHLLIYDDGPRHAPSESRAVEYALDTTAMTATLVWEFRHSPAIYTQYVGSVERLESGNTLVAFGLVGVVDEVDPAGDVVWEARVLNHGNGTSPYRVRRLASLYDYRDP